MKRFLSLVLALAMSMALAACSGGDAGSTANDTTSANTSQQGTAESGAQSGTPTEVTITSLNGSGEKADLTVPYDPQRIAILDMASLDILDAPGCGRPGGGHRRHQLGVPSGLHQR